MDFHGFHGSESCAAWDHRKGRPVAPIESFTRFQLAAIIDFHRFLGFSWIFIDFHDFHGFRSMVPSTVRGDLWPL